MPSPENRFEASAKSSKKCPVCDVALVMSERQGIEVDYCPECRGVWLDRGELDKIIKHSLQLQGAGPQDFGGEDRNAYGDDDDGYRQDSGTAKTAAPSQHSSYREDNGSRVGNYGSSGHDGGHGGSSRHGGGHGGSSRHGGGHGGSSRHGGGHGGSRHGGGHRGRSWLQDIFH